MSCASAPTAVTTRPCVRGSGGWPDVIWADELRELAVAADAERRLLILDMAKEAGSSGIEVPRARVALGDDSARSVLAHWLVREGRLDELREPADRGDEYARCLLAESQGEP